MSLVIIKRDVDALLGEGYGEHWEYHLRVLRISAKHCKISTNRGKIDFWTILHMAKLSWAVGLSRAHPWKQ